ncbi:hypothetical protein C2869_11075 [Saccharobesus litoralis]|uniref:Macrodomain Ori protein n=1 Tax=Saccharobesus litoralis TaxID=2172099 RepID=A0A2S0VRW0_9ALTE|nr:DUF413 domain-containing protein [Saccharobesus litoralis]AWB66944.1 hypothetical protein C2869_11075 [Saccharobesus litoralis]
MAAPTKQELLSRIYADHKNYPRGFRRSGDFSIKEADALEKFGTLIVALESGAYAPADDEDTHFVAVLRGEQEPDDLATKAWRKYIARINRPKLGSIYGSRIDTSQVDDGGSSDDLDNIDLGSTNTEEEVED